MRLFRPSIEFPRGILGLAAPCQLRWLTPLLVGLLLVTSAGRTAVAEVTDPAALLPESCLLYAELRDPPELLATLLDHPLRNQVEVMPQFRELRKNPEFQKLQIGLRIVEFKLQKLWRPAVEAATRGGMALGVDPATQGVVLLVRAEDEAILARARDTLLELTRKDASDNGRPDPVEELDYRGVSAYRLDRVAFAVHGKWLVGTNQTELGRTVLDRLLGDDAPALAGNEVFQAARVTSGDSATAWVWVHLAAARELGLAKELFRHHAEDFGGELIVGGVLSTLADAPYLAATLHVDTTGGRMVASVPSKASSRAEHSGHYFGPDGTSAAPPPLVVPRQVASVRAYREISTLWRSAPDLFDEAINAQMAKAESDLSTLAGGRSFSEDILGAIGPQVQLVVANQDYEAADVPEPAIKLPAFAAVFTLRDPEKSKRVLKIAYQQVVGFINLTAGQQGYPPLDLNTEDENGKLLVTASYLREDLERYAVENEVMGAARMQANFSPTSAFAGPYFVLSSTRELARDIVGHLPAAQDNVPGEIADVRTGSSAPERQTVNTGLDLAASELRSILLANREHLINQNMLEKGHSRQDAEQEIDGLFTLLEWIDSVSLNLSHDDAFVKLALELRVQQPPAGE